MGEGQSGLTNTWSEHLIRGDLVPSAPQESHVKVSSTAAAELHLPTLLVTRRECIFDVADQPPSNGTEAKGESPLDTQQAQVKSTHLSIKTSNWLSLKVFA